MPGSVQERRDRPAALPKISTGISPAAALRGGGTASKVSKLLAKMDDLQSAEKKQREYFCPKASSPIKGIFNCEAPLDTWNTSKHHRYADVLMADKFRDHELEIQQRMRERRREKLTGILEGGAMDRPSLVTIEMLPSERELFHRPKKSGLEQGQKKQEQKQQKTQEDLTRLPVRVVNKLKAQAGLVRTRFTDHKSHAPAGAVSADPAARRSQSCEPHSTAITGTSNEKHHPCNSVASFKPPKERWTKQVDLKTGRTYYFNHIDGHSTWIAPVQFPHEHGRFRHRQKCRQQEMEAREEMIQLRVVVKENPELLWRIWQVGSVDPKLESVMTSVDKQSSRGTTSPSQSLRDEAVTLSPRNLEDMALDAAASGTQCRRTLATEVPADSGVAVAAQAAGAMQAERSAATVPAGTTVAATMNSDSPTHQEVRIVGAHEALDIDQSAQQPSGTESSPQAHIDGKVRTSHVEHTESDMHDAGRKAGGRAANTEIEGARYIKVKGTDLEDIPHVECLKRLGTVLVVDVVAGTILRLSEALPPSQAAVLLQRNYRMRRSRVAIERKYRAEDYWRYLSRVACHLFNRTMALLLNTTTDLMLNQSTMQLQKTAEIAEDVHEALVQLQTNPKTRKGCKEDYRRFCLATGIRLIESRGSEFDPLFGTDPGFGIKSKKLKRTRIAGIGKVSFVTPCFLWSEIAKELDIYVLVLVGVLACGSARAFVGVHARSHFCAFLCAMPCM